MQSKYIRTIGIVLAVILSMAAIFYIGGLVNQFNLNYQKWLAEAGSLAKPQWTRSVFRRCAAGGAP